MNERFAFLIVRIADANKTLVGAGIRIIFTAPFPNETRPQTNPSPHRNRNGSV